MLHGPTCLCLQPSQLYMPLSVEEYSNRLVNSLAESYLPSFFAKARGSQEDAGEYVLLTVINIVGPMLTSHSNLMQ